MRIFDLNKPAVRTIEDLIRETQEAGHQPYGVEADELVPGRYLVAVVNENSDVISSMELESQETAAEIEARLCADAEEYLRADKIMCDVFAEARAKAEDIAAKYEGPADDC